MAKVIRKSEILLNGTLYPITGAVQPSLVSVFPGKVVIGDYGKDDEPEASVWATSDQRGGILVEEMDESVDTDRCWFSTADLRFRGHIKLPPLATAITPVDFSATITDGGLELWDDVNTLTNWTKDGTETVVRESSIKHGGSYSAKIGGPVTSDTKLYQDISWDNKYQGVTIKVTAWVRSDVAGTLRLRIEDGVDSTNGTANSGTGSFEQINVSHTLNASATQLRIIMFWDYSATPFTGYFDDVVWAGPSHDTSEFHYENFNSELYVSYGDVLTKLNSGGTAFEYVYSFNDSSTIKGLISSLNSMLYINRGDTDNYAYMSTSETVVTTDVADATFGVQWDGKLYKMDSLGEIWSATTPNAASPSWTSRGKIEGIADGDSQSLFVYRDADGNRIVYCTTKKGLYALDYGNAKWQETELALPDHPTGGKGVVWWRDALYVSAGTDVLKYQAASTATITSTGLNKDDGLPTEYRGEISKFIKGYNAYYAALDASITGVSTYSSLMMYDDHGWQVKWRADPSYKTTILRPSAAGDETNITYATASHWNDVDDATPDGVSTVVWTTLGSDSYERDLYNLENHSISGSPTIKSVTVYAYCRGSHAPWNTLQVSVKLSVKSGSTVSESTAEQATAPEYTLHSNTWTTNPDTSNPWTWAEINSLQAGVSLRRSTTSIPGYSLCTQLYVEVEYGSGSLDGTMTDGIISAVSDYRLWFDHAATIYYIPEQRSLLNPSQDTTYKFGTDAIHITPWFDANTQAGNKLALRLKIDFAGMSSDETVTVKYRKNHSYTDVDSGWQPLAVVTSDGLTTITFGGDGEGEVFRSIQFRFDLERGSTSTNSPDILYYALSYIKILNPAWGWRVTVDCSKTYGPKTPAHLLDDIVNTTENEELVEFTFRNDTDGTETYRVRVKSATGVAETGEIKEGQFTLFLTEP